MWNEAFVKLTLNLGEKKRNLLLFTLHPCWKCCALLLSSLLLILYEVNESHRELDHCHTYKFSVQNLMVLFKRWSQEGSRRKHKFLDALSLSKKKKHLRKDLELIELITGLDVGDWNFTVVLQFDLTVVFNFNLVHVRVWIECVL